MTKRLSYPSSLPCISLGSVLRQGGIQLSASERGAASLRLRISTCCGKTLRNSLHRCDIQDLCSEVSSSKVTAEYWPDDLEEAEATLLCS